MSIKVFIASSLDGYIARENGDLDWLFSIDNPDNNDFGYGDFISNIDALIMGRHTFEKVLGFEEWPYSKPVFVVSSTLQQVPAHLTKKVSIMNGAPTQIVTQLTDENIENFYIDGGRTIQNFLREDLIDEIIITTLPILLGKGIPLFGELPTDLQFTTKDVTVYNNGLVKRHLIRKR